MVKLALGGVGVGFRVRPFPVTQPPISAAQDRIGSFTLLHAEVGRDAVSCLCNLNRERLALVGTKRPFSVLFCGLADAFYTASGGIHDLLIKLFLATQLRLIYRSEVRGTDDEVITPDFVQQVARVDFRPVKHIVEALVNGDDRKLRRFDDMHAFDEQFRASMLDLTGPTIAPRLLSSQAAKEKQDAAKIELGDHYQIVWSRLQKMGLGDDIILRVIDAARAEGFDAEKDLLGFYEKVLKLKAKANRRPRPGNNLNIDELDSGDLRYIVLNASKSGITAFEALLEKSLRGLSPDIPEP